MILLESLKIQGISLDEVASSLGVSITSARLYVTGKRVPRVKRWKHLAHVLSIPLPELEDHYHSVLRRKNLLKHCSSCDKLFLARFETTTECSRKCRDAKKPKLKRVRISMTLPQIREETMEEKQEMREKLNDAVKRYLAEGKTIKVLPPDPTTKFLVDDYYAKN